MYGKSANFLLLVFTKPNMLLASNLDISLLTTRSSSAVKGGLPACLKKFRWALFGMLNRGAIVH